MNELFPTDSLGSLIRAPEGSYKIGFQFESRLRTLGHQVICGIDEAGRGPLAGPVVAAAVILDETKIPEGLQDSKKLTELQREVLFEEIIRTSQIAIATASASSIDQQNIRKATLSCMVRAATNLPIKADWYLIDGRDVPTELKRNGTAIIKGDGRSVSIAAASIVAKCIRDRIMKRCALQHPEYRFDQHKGYGTKTHREAIRQFGPCPIHRHSFAPIKDMK